MISVLFVIATAFVATTYAVAAPLPGASSEESTLPIVLTYLIHTEVEAVWNRQMSMLIGNSVIIGAIKLGEGSPALNKGLTWAGVGLCLAWFGLNWQGWHSSHFLIEDAQKATSNFSIKPFEGWPTSFWQERIFYFATTVIVMFFSIYCWLLKRHGWWKFWREAK
jgi:hypothetical protein